MDSLTHIVLGGCVGEAVGGRQLGKKALLIGAFAQSIPDIDVFAGLWLSPASDLLTHRGFTHSFLFIILAAPLLALLAEKLLAGTMTFRQWTVFFAIELMAHIFLDAFNSYGTGWFEPFSQQRVSFNFLFVADPFFTVPVAAVFAFLGFASLSHARRRLLTRLGILWAVAYLSYGGANKLLIDANVRDNIQRRGIASTAYFSTPTPLNNWLWYIVVNTKQGSYVGYRSVFDSKPEIEFEFFHRGDSLLSEIAGDEDFQHLHQFSQGYYTLEKWDDVVVFNDLRFGQVIGWRDRRSHFVFHFYLSHQKDNDLVVQRGRFKGWDNEAAKSLLHRILGN